MLIIWVNILCVLFLSYVYFKLSETENATLSNTLLKWITIVSAAGLVTKLGKSLLFVIFIVTIGWLILKRLQNRQKAND